MKKFTAIIILILIFCLAQGCYENYQPKPDYVYIGGVRIDLNKELAGFGEREKAHLRLIYMNLGDK